jgi:dUTP pyrophosphatase
MSVLNDTMLKTQVENGMVRDFIDSKVQIQQCGIELTLAKIEGFDSRGGLAFDNKHRSLPKYYDVEFGGIGGFANLAQGAYLITFNETVSIPINMCAIARPRSSLLRMGVTVETAVWDPGYEGKSQACLMVNNPKGFSVAKDARMIQLVFLTLDDAATHGYSGIYQHEGLKSGEYEEFRTPGSIPDYDGLV